jgi:hypothetical protein
VCNAAEAVHQGFIEVAFEKLGADCSIRVSDTGPGNTPCVHVFAILCMFTVFRTRPPPMQQNVPPRVCHNRGVLRCLARGPDLSQISPL